MPVTVTSIAFDSIDTALAEIKAGRAIVVVDDENRENEGDLICAAQFATPDLINFMAVQARGLICLAMTGERLDALELPLMVTKNTDSNQTAFTVSIDAAPHLGVKTGISAEDRAKTVQVAINPVTRPDDLTRPGHVFPIRAKAGGVCYRLKHDRFVHRETVCNFPSQFGTFQLYAYRNLLDQTEHIAIVKGDPALFGDQPVMVRMHSECLTGDALGSLRCDCRQQLQAALKMIENNGLGVVVYLRQEGRGIGLINKLKAYSLQDIGLDTVEANERLGFPADLRDYGMGAQMLNDLGVRNIRLITNNPRKIAGLKGYGLEIVERVPLLIEANDYNSNYLATKAEKLGHLFLQTYLVTIALSWGENPPSISQRYHQLEKLRQLSRANQLSLQEETRPVANALFDRAPLIVHLGLDIRQGVSSNWYKNPSHPYLLVIDKILNDIKDWSEIERLEFLISDGDDSMTGLQMKLDRQKMSDEDFSQLPQLATQIIYSFTRDSAKN